MAFQYSYALEKFDRAIYHLATGEGDIRARLLTVLQDDLLTIKQAHLPPTTHGDWESIKRRASKYEEKYPGYADAFRTDDGRFDWLIPSRLQASLYRMKNRTGASMARRIFSIWLTLNEQSHAKR